MQLYKESFREHNFLWTQWKKLKHFTWLKKTKVGKDSYSSGGEQESEVEEAESSSGVADTSNPSNKFKVYAKIENNYHLSNKYALFYNMRKYYLANGRD